MDYGHNSPRHEFGGHIEQGWCLVEDLLLAATTFLHCNSRQVVAADSLTTTSHNSGGRATARVASLGQHPNSPVIVDRLDFFFVIWGKGLVEGMTILSSNLLALSSDIASLKLFLSMYSSTFCLSPLVSPSAELKKI